MPELPNVTAFVIEVSVPVKPRLYAPPVVKVGVISAPLKPMLPVVAVNATPVSVFTAAKVAPPELVTVKVFKVVVPPMAPATLTVPTVPVDKVSDCVFAVVPLIVLVKLMF